MENGRRVYDLDERLIAYAAGVVALTESLPATRAGNHIAGQLLRSGTSPAPNYGEASAAESKRDFLHKMGICLKELRESPAWLQIVARSKVLRPVQVSAVLAETEELVRIFGASIATARGKRSDSHQT